MKQKLYSVSSMVSAIGFTLAAAHAGSDPRDYRSSQVSAGDTALTLPEVEQICEVVRNAASGQFLGKDGKEIAFRKSGCSIEAYNKDKKACSTTLSEILAQNGVSPSTPQEEREEKISKACGAIRGTDSQIATYCALHSLARSGSQTVQYCAAHESAKKARGFTTAVGALDAVAAAACWAEYFSFKGAQAKYIAAKKAHYQKMSLPGAVYEPFRYRGAVGSMGPGSIGNMGICGGAALAASGLELAHAVHMIAGNHSAGSQWITGKNNVKDKSQWDPLKITEILSTQTLSLLGARIGLCYYGKKKDAKSTISGLIDKVCAHLPEDGRPNREMASKLKEARKERSESIVKVDKAISDAKKAGYEVQVESVQKLEAYESCNRMVDAQYKTNLTVSKIDATVCEAKLSDDGALLDNNEELARVQAEILAFQNNSDEKAKQDEKPQELKEVDEAKKLLEEAEKNLGTIYAAYEARANLAKQAAFIYTGLTALRAASVGAALFTESRAKNILQSMFHPASTSPGDGSNPFVGATPQSFLSMNSVLSVAGSSNAGKTNASTAAPQMDAFLAPPSNAFEAQARSAGQRSRSSYASAASQGASGVGGLIASTAASMGAPASAQGLIRSATASAFANLPKETGGYGSAGGGGLAQSSSSSGSGDLNLKALFGGADAGGGEQLSPGREDIAFRSIAMEDDIWHSKNPKGHNLFQIVSDKYDNVQRKHSLGH